jgi:localization factor PodJL
MNSRVSWSVDGIDPSVRERAEAAARRAGMSLNDWLNSTVGESAPPNFRNPSAPPSPSHDVADIHQRLDSITRQIERISQPMPRNDAPREQGVARQLNDAISRLDARLSQISNPQAQRQNQNRQQRQSEAVERAAGQVYAAQAYPSQATHPSQVYPQAQAAPVYRNSPPLSPASMDFAVAEIAARQNELDAPPPRAMPPRHAPPIAPAMAAPPPPPPGPDFSALERHLFKITSQIEALQRPDIEQSIARRTFRNPRRHHRGDAAPGDRVDRERSPLAVAPHRGQPPERHRRQRACGYRTRARRNPRGAALADVGRATRRL